MKSFSPPSNKINEFEELIYLKEVKNMNEKEIKYLKDLSGLDDDYTINQLNEILENQIENYCFG